MIGRIAPAQLVLGSFCAVLTLIFFYEIAAPIAPYEGSLASEAFKPDAVTLTDSASAPSSASFDDIETHPIFSPSRKPLASSSATPQGGGAAPFPSDVALIGVIIDGQDRMALVKSSGAALASSVRQGQQIEGWTITAIDGSGITLDAGGSKRQMLLSENRGSPQTSGAVPSPGVDTTPTPPIPGIVPPSVSSKPPPDNAPAQQQQ